ncbi:MAG: tetratricopeptide repeat protein [Marinovum algicola]|uniref:tetratricopeptide repeat protein n=1 Tax=Alphaproteobacteria TaxID=28211 RepID=UPI0032EC8CFD
MDDRKRIAAALKDHLARQRMSREQFAFKTRLGKSTVDKLLTGLFSDRTLAIVESQTGLTLRRPLDPGSAGGEGPASHAQPGPAPGPSIAVLPFVNLSGDDGQDYFSDGITEDIIAALARLRWLFVIARQSSFAYKGQAFDVRQVSRDLGVRYVLEGSVRSAGDRFRIVGQLIDAETGRCLWAERYDRASADMFAVQDDIAGRVVAAVEPQIYAVEGFRAAGGKPESIDTWGLVARALMLLNRVENRQNAEARALLERAVEREPGYARAHALLGWATWWATLCYWCADTEEGYRRAAGHAQDALSHDPSDPWARMVYGMCLSTAGQHDRAIGELQEALRLNPNFALGCMAHGWALLRAGSFDAAIAETAQALRLSPVDSFSGFYTSIHGLALLADGRFGEALPFLRASVAAFAEYSGHYNSLISCCGHLGLVDEAREFVAARNRIGPPLRLSVLRRNLGRFAHCGVFVDGLRKAGVTE